MGDITIEQSAKMDDNNQEPITELQGPDYLLLLYLLLFLFIIGAVGYGLCCTIPTLLARYCSCYTSRCCGCLPCFRCRFDAPAYRRERETLRQLRDIRRAQRQQEFHALRIAASQPHRGAAAVADPALIRAMNGTPNNIAVLAAAQRNSGALSPWTSVDLELRRLAILQASATGRPLPQQQQEADSPHFQFHDRASMWATFHQINSLGLIIVPGDQEQQEEQERHVRDNLSSEERKQILDDVLEFKPYHRTQTERAAVNEEQVESEEANAIDEADLERGEGDVSSAANIDSVESDEEFGSKKSSLVIPAHETPDAIDTTCAICLDEFEEGDICNSTQPDCPHLFHKTCIVLWLEKHSACPVCRREMVTETQWRDAATKISEESSR